MPNQSEVNVNEAEQIEFNGEMYNIVAQDEQFTTAVHPITEEKVRIRMYLPTPVKAVGEYGRDVELADDQGEEIQEDVPVTVDMRPICEAINAEGNAVIMRNILRSFCYRSESDAVNSLHQFAGQLAHDYRVLVQAYGTESVNTELGNAKSRAILWALTAEAFEVISIEARKGIKAATGNAFVNHFRSNRVGDGLKDSAPLSAEEAGHAASSLLEELANEAGGKAALARNVIRQNNMRAQSKKIAFVPFSEEMIEALNTLAPTKQRKFLEAICDQLLSSRYNRNKDDRAATAKRMFNSYDPVYKPQSQTFLNANTAARAWEHKARRSAARLLPQALELFAEGTCMTYMNPEQRDRIRKDAYRRTDFIAALVMNIVEGLEETTILNDEKFAYDDKEREFILNAVAYTTEHEALPDYLDVDPDEVGDINRADAFKTQYFRKGGLLG